MSGIIDRIVTSWGESQQALAQRVADGTQPSIPYATPEFLLGANSFYVLVTMILYKVMQHRASGFHFKKVIAVYNCICVLAAGYVLVGILLAKWREPDEFVCIEGCVSTPQCHFMAHVFWVFYAQKFWEFIDTWFFLLRKSLRQVTFLHLFHHSSITIVVGLILPHDFCGDMYLPIALNAFVHVLMYSHYLVTALGVRSWWSKYLTSLQLIQFVLISTQSTIALRRGKACGVPDWAKALLIAYMGSMVLLFGNFFLRKYVMKKNTIPPACAGVIKENDNGFETKTFNGTVNVAKDGTATVKMNAHYRFLRKSFKESGVALVYQLTPILSSMPDLHVSSECDEAGCFAIAGGKAGAKVSWTITMNLQHAARKSKMQ